MTINSSIRESIKKNKTTHEIEQEAVQSGMLTLKRYGVELIREQLTTISSCRKSAILKTRARWRDTMSLARQIVDFAIKAGSSDIHLEEGSPSLSR